MSNLNYCLNMEQVTRLMRKNKVVKRQKSEADISYISRCMTKAYAQVPDMKNSLDCIVHCEEYHWLRNGKQVYFFDTPQFAEAIAKGSYKIDNFTGLYRGDESFMLMIPRKLKLAGRLAGSGALVTIGRHDTRMDRLFAPFFNMIDQPTPNVSIVGDHGDFTINVCYQERANSDEYMRCSLPDFQMTEILKFTNYDDYSAYMDETNKFDYLGGKMLNNEERDYQFELLRLIAGFLAYRNALPERLKEGYPQGGKKEAQSVLINELSPMMVKSPQGAQNGSTGHYRSWHIRQLVNERYYRGEHAHKAAGSRFVFVSDSVVDGVKSATLNSEP